MECLLNSFTRSKNFISYERSSNELCGSGKTVLQEQIYEIKTTLQLEWSLSGEYYWLHKPIPSDGHFCLEVTQTRSPNLFNWPGLTLVDIVTDLK